KKRRTSDRSASGSCRTMISLAGTFSGRSPPSISRCISAIRSLLTPSKDTTRAKGITASLSDEAPTLARRRVREVTQSDECRRRRRRAARRRSERARARRPTNGAASPSGRLFEVELEPDVGVAVGVRPPAVGEPLDETEAAARGSKPSALPPDRAEAGTVVVHLDFQALLIEVGVEANRSRVRVADAVRDELAYEQAHVARPFTVQGGPAGELIRELARALRCAFGQGEIQLDGHGRALCMRAHIG